MPSRRPPVLIVEDDPDIAAILRLIVETDGYTAYVARDGKEGLACLRALAPRCLVLLDLAMPRMDGAEFRRRQLADRKLASVPVIVVSGDIHTHETARQLRVAASVQKPFTVQALLETLQRVEAGQVDASAAHRTAA